MPVHIQGFVPGKETETQQRVWKGSPAWCSGFGVRQGLSPGPWPDLSWEPIPLPTQKGSQLVGVGFSIAQSDIFWGLRQFSLHGIQGYNAQWHQKAWKLVFQVGEGPVPTQDQAVAVGDSEPGIDGSHEE